MENIDPVEPDNQGAEESPESTNDGGWKGQLRPDLKSNPLLSKFSDDPQGLNKALESHVSLERLLGHEKVPIPQSADDLDGWNRFAKAMGIPDAGSGYELPDAVFPDELKPYAIDKELFADVMLSHKIHPEAVKGLWDFYQKKSIQDYQAAKEVQENQRIDAINSLRQEWGSAYEHNVEKAQTVINKFSESQEQIDYLTEILSRDPRGIKFLAKLGSQFDENHLGDIPLAPVGDDFAEIEKMRKDLDGPYFNSKGKFTEAEHQAAVEKVNRMTASIKRGRG